MNDQDLLCVEILMIDDKMNDKIYCTLMIKFIVLMIRFIEDE
jgi:hypothetical protein